MKSYFKFNKQERSGIFFLLLLIIILQGIFFYLKLQPFKNQKTMISVDEAEQSIIDSLKLLAQSKDLIKVYPFNPNFITDYKGYALGMTVEEINRLHAFRAKNKFVNSKEEFQKVTQVHDTLLNSMEPYFEFPAWVKDNKSYKKVEGKHNIKEVMIIKDINSANASDLRMISGIGDKLSARIIKFRDRLGGFLVNEQLYDVYGLEADVVQRALREFQVVNPPKTQKININTATASEMAKLVYISYTVANKIVDLREQNGSINSFDELTKVDDFPSEKLERIALYLSL